MVTARARTYCYSVKTLHCRNITFYSALLCVMTPANVYGRHKIQRERYWELVASCFYRKVYVFYSVKYFLALWGHWIHLESFRKQRSVYIV